MSILCMNALHSTLMLIRDGVTESPLPLGGSDFDIRKVSSGYRADFRGLVPSEDFLDMMAAAIITTAATVFMEGTIIFRKISPVALLAMATFVQIAEVPAILPDPDEPDDMLKYYSSITKLKIMTVAAQYEIFGMTYIPSCPVSSTSPLIIAWNEAYGAKFSGNLVTVPDYELFVNRIMRVSAKGPSPTNNIIRALENNGWYSHEKCVNAYLSQIFECLLVYQRAIGNAKLALDGKISEIARRELLDELNTPVKSKPRPRQLLPRPVAVIIPRKKSVATLHSTKCKSIVRGVVENFIEVDEKEAVPTVHSDTSPWRWNPYDTTTCRISC